MDVATLIESLKVFGPAVVTTGLFVWYLHARDKKLPEARDGDAGRVSTASKEDASEAQTLRTAKVEDAILQMAVHCARQTDILNRQTDLLSKCVEGHHETLLAVEQLKGQMQGLAPRMRN